MIKSMDLELWNTPMGISTRVLGKMVRGIQREFTIIPMEIFMMGYGIETRNKGLEF